MAFSGQVQADRELIRRLGGSTKVAAMLATEGRCSVQRVQNWKTRGIPPGVKLSHPHIFLWRVDAQLTSEAVHG